MNDRSHTVLIGAFIVGALLIAITGTIFITGSGLGSDRQKIFMVFDGSVKGLSIGAPIALRGVEIGQVTDIRLILDNETVDVIMQVEAEINNQNIQQRGAASGALMDELISRGMRAQLNTQSLLTGLLYVQLDFFPGSPVRLVDIESDYPQIPTIPTELERITREIESLDIAKMAEDLSAVAVGVNRFVNNPEFQTLPGDLKSTMASLEATSDELRKTLNRSGPQLEQLMTSVAATADTLNTELPEIAALARENLKLLTSAIAAFEGAMNEIDGLVSPDSATTYELNRALRELGMAARALQLLAKSLEEQPEAFIRGKSEEKR